MQRASAGVSDLGNHIGGKSGSVGYVLKCLLKVVGSYLKAVGKERIAKGEVDQQSDAIRLRPSVEQRHEEDRRVVDVVLSVHVCID